MIRRITKTLLIASLLIGVAQARQSTCLGWSLNPFAAKEEPQTRNISMTTTQKPPSAWNKVATGTKNIFNKTGETLGLKKKEPKKAPAIVAARPRTIQQRPKQGGMFSWLAPKEDKPKEVKDWLGRTKQVTL